MTIASLMALAVCLVSVAYPAFCASEVLTHEDLSRNLGPLLSPNASISLPGTADFREKTTRWIESLSPDIRAVVAVATEDDVRNTVVYADKHDIPILAFSGGHGAISSMENVHNGIEIWMRQMNHVEIHPDGKTVTIGGGAKSKEVTQALWAAGKQTVTGVCECVGITAPMLGGGHGTLQGEYGLLSDQLLSARVVLANGSAVTASQNENPDLFWALQGAGHNFGIVTEFTYKIYDAQIDKPWVLEQLVFTQDKLEQLYSLHNEVMKIQPAELVLWSFLRRVPDIDPVLPVFQYIILYDGPLEEQKQYASRYHALGPVSSSVELVPYPEIPGKTGTSEDSLACMKGAVILRFPVELQEFNVSALRKTYQIFSDKIIQEPAFANTFYMIEAFSLQAVQAVEKSSTAVPYRDNKLILSPAIVYFPNTSLDVPAKEWGNSMRNALQEGSGSSQLYAYINYAYGDESLEAWYGYEPWRLEKLRSLKKEFDPKGKFSFYAPIS